MTPATTMGRRVFHGAAWSGANTMLVRLAGICISAFVLRIVTPQEFGVFAVALTVFTVVASFSELGLSSCLARADMDPVEIAPTVAALALAASAALSMLMILMADPLAELLGAPTASGAVRVLALCVLIGGVTTVPTSILVREFRQDRVFLSTVVAFFPANGLLVALAVAGQGQMAFAWSRVVGQVVAGAVIFRSAGRVYWPRPRWACAGRVLRFGLPLAGANLVGFTLLNADYAFIGRMLGATLLGVYMLAFNIASWSTSVLGGTINSVAMPAFSRIKAQGGDVGESLVRAVQLVALIAFPITFLTVALAGPLVATVYGHAWSSAVPVLRWLCLYGAVFSVTLVVGNLLVGIGLAGRLFLGQLVWLGALVPAMLLGLRVAGTRGVAAAHVLVLVIVVLPLYARWLSPIIATPLRAVARAARGPVLSSFAAGVAALTVSRLSQVSIVQLSTGGIAGVAVYLGASAHLWVPLLPLNASTRLRRTATFLGAAFGAGRPGS